MEVPQCGTNGFRAGLRMLRGCQSAEMLRLLGRRMGYPAGRRCLSVRRRSRFQCDMAPCDMAYRIMAQGIMGHSAMGGRTSGGRGGGTEYAIC